MHNLTDNKCANNDVDADRKHLRCHNDRRPGHILCDRCRIETGGYSTSPQSLVRLSRVEYVHARR